jgi:uncharacterized protein
MYEKKDICGSSKTIMKQNIRNIYSLFSGAIIGILGGLMGLGGAEFRLPVLVGIFKFGTLQAIIINLVVSLVTVAFSFIFRSMTIPVSEVFQNYPVVLNLLSGSLIGAFIGVKLATKVKAHRLDRIVFVFLLLLGIFMIVHPLLHFNQVETTLVMRIILGFLAGLAIGIFSSMLGVAGGELIIPTIILLYAIDIKLAGSLSLCVSFPTVIVGLMKYRKSNQFSAIKENWTFVVFMAVGSVIGAFAGSKILTSISAGTLQVVLGSILLISAIKTFLKKK